ncbi:DUF2065 family protein [Salmonella enterica subsp. enterica]|nr:DUF2065 family protein [Salmonella enterica subsp. enterica]
MNSTTGWRFAPGALVLEGLGPMLYPGVLGAYFALAQLPENVLRRFGGGLVVAGVVASLQVE